MCVSLCVNPKQVGQKPSHSHAAAVILCPGSEAAMPPAGTLSVIWHHREKLS